VIVEGAGSPAEVNLRAGDIANMGFARGRRRAGRAGRRHRPGRGDRADRGHAGGARPGDAALIKGFLINKFRGDPRLFDDGYARIEARTGWPGFGVLPWFAEAWRLPAEDALDLDAPRGDAGFHIVCPRCRGSRISTISTRWRRSRACGWMLGPGARMPGDADLVILPAPNPRGAIWPFCRAGLGRRPDAPMSGAAGHVLGICGGYQMLGPVVADPEGIEGRRARPKGLGLLDLDTVMTPEKRLTEVDAVHVATGQGFHGYEIHIGQTDGPDRARPFAHVAGVAEGAGDASARVQGSYLHGMFRDDAFRAAWLAGFGVTSARQSYGAGVEATLDALAAHMEAHLDVEGLLGIAG
jgi:adenosylcobyric acid synthase